MYKNYGKVEEEPPLFTKNGKYVQQNHSYSQPQSQNQYQYQIKSSPNQK